MELETLLQCVADSAPRYTLPASHSYGLHRPRVQLHPAFACTLRTALRCGALEDMLAHAGLRVTPCAARSRPLCRSCGLDTSVLVRRCIGGLQRARRLSPSACRVPRGNTEAEVTHEHMTYWVRLVDHARACNTNDVT